MLESSPKIVQEFDAAEVEFSFDASSLHVLRDKRLPLLTEADQERAQQLADGLVDLNQLPEGENWAWLGAPRWMDSRRETIKRTTGRFTCIDFASAVPEYTSMTEGRHFKRCRDKAASTIGNLQTTILDGQSTRFGSALESTGIADTTSISALLGKILADEELPALLESAVSSTLYSFDTTDEILRATDGSREEAFAQQLFFELLTSRSIYKQKTQADLRSLEWRWSTDFQRSLREQTANLRLASLEVRTAEATTAGHALKSLKLPKSAFAQNLTEEQKALLEKSRETRPLEDVSPGSSVILLYSLARTMTDMLAHDPTTMRPFKIISADSAERETLLEQSEIAVDPVTRHTGFHRRAIERIANTDLHHQVDIFAPLPYQDESFALITCFDGPYAEELPSDPHECAIYLRGVRDSLKEYVRIMQQLGKTVIWPYGPRIDGRVDMDVTYGILSELQDVHKMVDISLKVVLPEELLEWMTDMEREVIHRRGILEKSYIPEGEIRSHGMQFALIIDKRRKGRRTKGKDTYISASHEN